jgi:hypothetical protein
MAVVETKVKASTAAAAVSGLALWALGRYVFKGSAVPDVVTSWVYVLVPGVLAFGAGWLARHTSVPVQVTVTQTQAGPGPGAPLTAMPPTASQSVAAAPPAGDNTGGPAR